MLVGSQALLDSHHPDRDSADGSSQRLVSLVVDSVFGFGSSPHLVSLVADSELSATLPAGSQDSLNAEGW